MTGMVKVYIDAKGFGFIAPDEGGNDIFVHISNCAEDIDALSKGQRVRYDERISPRSGKREACAVELI